MSDDHIGVKVNGVLYVRLEDARKLREGWDKADERIDKQAAEIASLRAELDTARREGMAEAVSQARARADFWPSGNNKEAKIRHDEARKIAAAISAAAKEDRPSEEIIREDRDAWPDRQANDPIRAAAKEGE